MGDLLYNLASNLGGPALQTTFKLIAPKYIEFCIEPGGN